MAAPVVFNFRERRRPPLLLQFPEGEFELDGNLLVDDVGDILQAEQAIFGLSQADGDAEVARIWADAQDAIRHLLAKANPGRDAEVQQLRFTVAEMLQLIAAITGRKSATEMVLDTILESFAPGDEDGKLEQARKAAEAAQAAEGASSPLRPSRRSRKSSSRSGSATNGRRTGGATSPGGSSTGTAELPAGE